MLKRLFPEPEVPPLSEPLIVQDLVITGAEIEADQRLVRFAGWTLSKTGKLEPAERRIVVRLALPIDAGRSRRRNSAIGRWTTDLTPIGARSKLAVLFAPRSPRACTSRLSITE